MTNQNLRNCSVMSLLLALLLLPPSYIHAQQSVRPLFVFNCANTGSAKHQTSSCPMGGFPTKLIQSADGNFYGTSETGGTGSGAAGTVFRLTPNGQLTTLYTFLAVNGKYPNGATPGAIIEGVDGFLYGFTVAGGSTGTGVVYKVSKSGALQVLHESGVSQLTFGRDGNLYGIGADSFGNTALVRISTAGSFEVLHTFQPKTDGIYPAGLILASNGNIVGTTVDVEAFRITSLFCLTPAGEFKVLQTFHYGQFLTSPPIESQDGKLYAALDFVAQSNGSLPPGLLQHDLADTNFQEIVLPYATQQWMQELLEDSEGDFWGSSSQLGAVVRFTRDGAALTQVDFAGYGLLQASDGRILGENGNVIFDLEPALPAPKPQLITPNETGGATGTKITIYGSHLVGTTDVSFNGVRAAFEVLTSGTIVAIVPAGATTGLITITNAGGASESTQDFVVP